MNKKAFEQYGNFTKQRDSLETRKSELDASHASIQELIKTLDFRKDEAIERTFAQAAKNFTSVWKALVPDGHGDLVMLARENESQDVRDGEGVENYSGVAIQVTFVTQSDQVLRMPQLSGGQKSLVALALIFAIQVFLFNAAMRSGAILSL